MDSITHSRKQETFNRRIIIITKYTSLIHSHYWFQNIYAADAGINNLKLFEDIMLKNIYPEAALNAQKKSEHHSCYLKQENAVFSLYSNLLNRGEKII